ncbi:uncharacterized protein LOC135369741 [Ornithodoros turicata]|uniref:uncharacterized protein LOC135369741 n=1 Tax=Ornithodoros turicata TaxID=34597 RepID=UPI0031387D61
MIVLRAVFLIWSGYATACYAICEGKYEKAIPPIREVNRIVRNAFDVCMKLIKGLSFKPSVKYYREFMLNMCEIILGCEAKTPGDMSAVKLCFLADLRSDLERKGILKPKDIDISMDIVNCSSQPVENLMTAVHALRYAYKLTG